VAEMRVITLALHLVSRLRELDRCQKFYPACRSIVLSSGIEPETGTVTLPTLIPISCESSQMVTWRLSWIISSILTLAGVTEILGLRASGSFSARSHPSLNDLAQLHTLACDNHSSPNWG
jgi:hypothetical protein